MGKAADRKQEFSELEQMLMQTADDAVNCLKVLKGNLREFDRRHGLVLVSTSKFHLRRDTRAVKDTASDLRGAANQITDRERPSESEVTAARSAMNAASNVMDELVQAARSYDRKNLKSRGLAGAVADLLGGNKDRKKESKSHKSVDRVGSEGILRAPDTVEEVVITTLRDCFSGFPALKNQISIAEKSLSSQFVERSNEVVP